MCFLLDIFDQTQKSRARVLADLEYFFNEVSLQRENLAASILPQTLDIKDSLKDERNSRDNV